MCKRYTYTPEAQLASEGAYEGQTMRLDRRQDEWGVRRAAGHYWRFPWWTLWLIWPLILLLKWTVPLALSVISTAAGALNGLSAPIVALVLIAVGIALLRRS
jgi:hypothetical protein